MFGLYGQGELTQPTAGNAWASRVVQTDKSHYMMINLFPYDLTWLGLQTGEQILVQIESVGWRAAREFNAPDDPVPITVEPSADKAVITGLGIGCICLLLLIE